MDRAVAIGHGPPGPTTPLQPPLRYLLALALLRALPGWDKRIRHAYRL